MSRTGTRPSSRRALACAFSALALLACDKTSHENHATPEPAHGEHGPHDGSDIAHYTCPMHPSVKKDGPGQCPICGMTLTPVTKRDMETGTIVVDEVRRQRIGVKTAEVKRHAMRRVIRAVGDVKIDETRLTDVNLRMSGWVERLVVNETGQRVKKGQTLFTLYSPELYAAQREHLTAMNRQRAGGGGATSDELARASQQRLRLLGMSGTQIKRLEQRKEAWEHMPIVSPAKGYVIEKNVVEGARIERGSRVYRIADLSRVWIDAEVYESDLLHARVGQPATIELPYMPGKRFEGRIDYIYPTLQEATRTGRVRVVLENPELALKPDMYANVMIEVDLGERLAVPEEAVIYTGPRRLVFVDLGEGRLRPQEVQVGVHAGGLYEVTDGLEAGDRIVTSGNFLIAAESRIRSASEYWRGGHAH